MTMRRRIVLAVLSTALLLSSCTDDSEQIGMTFRDGRPTVIIASCVGDKPRSIQVVNPGNDAVDEGDDEVLWQIDYAHTRPVSVATPIGVAPPRFETIVPLRDPLPRTMEMTLDVDGQTWGGLYFTVSELREDRILTDRGESSRPPLSCPGPRRGAGAASTPAQGRS
jgi:hypothetical protein